MWQFSPVLCPIKCAAHDIINLLFGLHHAIIEDILFGWRVQLVSRPHPRNIISVLEPRQIQVNLGSPEFNLIAAGIHIHIELVDVVG